MFQFQMKHETKNIETNNEAEQDRQVMLAK